MARLGGIWEAKPKDIHAELVGEFPELTVQVRPAQGKTASRRHVRRPVRRVVRQHRMPRCAACGLLPTLPRPREHPAERRPCRAAASQPLGRQASHLTRAPHWSSQLQSTKWHLYAQRRAEERIRQRHQEAGTP